MEKDKYIPKKNLIKGAIRRLFSRSPSVIDVLTEAIHPTIKGVRGGKQYICSKCKKTFANKDIQVDHIEEVVDLIPVKHMSYDMIVERIFCNKENLQALCKNCHKNKTKKANKIRRENSKKFKYIVYETVNIKNNKKYIGVHGCINLNDGYLGSGTILKKAIKKYGKESFIRSVLFATFDIKKAYKKEKELVTPIIMKDDKFYNLKEGGIGGQLSKKTKKKISKTKKGTNVGKDNPNYGKTPNIKIRKKIGNRLYKQGKNHSNAKQVKCIETGKIYDCIKDTGVLHISRAIRSNLTAGGYHWEYVKN